MPTDSEKSDNDDGRFTKTLCADALKLLVCQKCGANRMQEHCLQPSDCGMAAVAHEGGLSDFVKFDMTKQVPVIYSNRT